MRHRAPSAKERRKAKEPPIVCTTCNARATEPCTTPTDTGRRPVSWFHLARRGGEPGK